MATETGERKATRSSQIGAPPPEAEHLPCPRCDSTNTKFCYYNNYNFSQPRHFCKSCRRYWTHGGTLRDIPIGGGSRKNAKRSRTFSTSTTTSSGAFSSTHHDFHHLPSAAASQLMLPLSAAHGGSMPFLSDGKMGGSFTSLLNSSPAGNGLLALGGFGLGIDDVGFGLGRVAWPFSGAVEGGQSGGGAAVGGNTWQLENGEGGFVGGGDYFAFPDLAISTPRSVLK